MRKTDLGSEVSAPNDKLRDTRYQEVMFKKFNKLFIKDNKVRGLQNERKKRVYKAIPQE